MSQMSLVDLDEFQIAIHGALTTWGDLGSSDDDLLSFLLLVQEKRTETENKGSVLDKRRITNDILLSALEELEEQSQTEAAVLRARFLEGEIIRQVAQRQHASTDQVNRWQKTAIRNLSLIILSRELVLREQRRQELEAMLPPSPYVQLFGFESTRQEVIDLLRRSDDSWIVAIVGIGGIGKTSLADFATRQLLNDLVFENIVWLRANERSLSGATLSPEQCYEHLLLDLAEKIWPEFSLSATGAERDRLRRVLKKRPHLIIIDNLETEENTAFVLEQVQELTEPSKFLITSRARPTLSPAVHFVSLEELSLPDTSNLFRHHAKTIGLNELSHASEGEIKAVYSLTGGNPLAIKLVVSLAAVLPFPQILNDLTRNHSGPIEEMYRFIYLESWRLLSAEAQALLQAMPLVAGAGAKPEQMQAISQLSSDDFWPAVTELAARSLLEVRGTIHDRRYGIHRLTDTFLRTEIIYWP